VIVLATRIFEQNLQARRFEHSKFLAATAACVKNA
jgi:hypothetical protein